MMNFSETPARWQSSADFAFLAADGQGLIHARDHVLQLA